MPIVVQCVNPMCGTVLQVREQFAGRVCRCPICELPLTIPGLILPQPTPAAYLPPPPPIPEPAADPGLIEVRCTKPGCGRVIRVRSQFAGKTGKCPACGTAVKVPAPSATPGLLTEEIKLSPMEGDEEVKRPAAVQSDFDLVEDDEPPPAKAAPKLVKPVKKAAKAPPPSAPPIPIVCPSCWAKLKVPAKYAGRNINCPKCGTATAIPGATPAEGAAPEEVPPWLQPPPQNAGAGAAPFDWLAGPVSPFLDEALAKSKRTTTPPATEAAPPAKPGEEPPKKSPR